MYLHDNYNSFEAQRGQLLQRINQSGVHDDSLVLDVFRYQYRYNRLYADFVDLMGVKIDKIHSPNQIPHIPISFFKYHQIKSGVWNHEKVFLSSRTSGTIPGRHFIRQLDIYHQNTIRCFCTFFKNPAHYCFLALLPSYLEQEDSSLVSMVSAFIRLSKYDNSGFYRYDTDRLVQQLNYNINQKIPTILIGVSYALLDLAQQHPMDLSAITIIETGGMKGRRKEMSKAALHHILAGAFQKKWIASEYGMTELQSQAYSLKEGVFSCPPTMKVQTVSVQDPLELLSYGLRGQLQITDLANLDSCAFIRTDDYGQSLDQNNFTILGRLDGSEQRGCNLLVD